MRKLRVLLGDWGLLHDVLPPYQRRRHRARLNTLFHPPYQHRSSSKAKHTSHIIPTQVIEQGSIHFFHPTNPRSSSKAKHTSSTLPTPGHRARLNTLHPPTNPRSSSKAKHTSSTYQPRSSSKAKHTSSTLPTQVIEQG